MRVFLATLALGLAAPLPAQGTSPSQELRGEPKSAAEVIARFVAATGGEAAWRAIKSEHLRTQIEFKGDVATRIESFKLSPNKILLRSTIMLVGSNETGFDGKVGWPQSDRTGPVLLSGAPLEELRQSIAISGPPDRSARPMKLTGRRTIDGRTALELRVKEDGEEVAEYYDLESGLLIAMHMKPDFPADTLALLRFGDYKKFGRVLIATTWTVRLPDGQTAVTRTTHVSHAPIDTMVFVPPAAIRALVTKRSP